MKPFKVSVLITRIRQTYSEKVANNGYLARTTGRRLHARAQVQNEDAVRQSSVDAIQIVTELISSIGVTPNLAGYNYLREAVLAGMEQPERLANVSGNIYTILAEKYNAKVRNIDRAIRCALLSAQKKTKNANGFMREMQESILINNGKRLNNSQVIAYLAKKAGSRLAETKSRMYRGM
jgi:two-component system response regulator (stage 0 sporulation protein A)